MAVVRLTSRASLAGVALLLPLLGCGAADRATRVALLPFTLVAAGAGDSAFADSLSRALAERLAQSGRLTVRLRKPATALLADSVPAERLARQLSADWILRGSLLHAGDSVRLTLSLSNGDSGEAPWVRTFTGSVRPIQPLLERLRDSLLAQIQPRYTPPY